jgi:agmatinase
MKRKQNFANIQEARYYNVGDAKVIIVQVPYDVTASYRKGARHGPSAIISASTYMEQFDEELNRETYRVGIHTQRPLKVKGCSPKKMTARVEHAVGSVIDHGKFPVVLGGEHSVSIGAIRAVAKKVPKFSILQLDAHCDLRDEYMNSKYNHGCFARRVLGLAPIVQVGVRSMSKDERDLLPHPKIRSISMYEIHSDKDWIKKACQVLSEHVYVSIDLDVFDPSVVPATGTPEPGGLGWYDIITLLRTLAKKKHIIGFDVVELCPIKGHDAANFLVAKLIYRFLGYIFERKRRM